MRSFEAAVAAAPAAEAGLFAAAGLFVLVAWVALLGLQHGWHATIGASLRWLAEKFDAVSIGFRHVGHVKPLGPIADAFRAVDKDTHHALGAAALNCEHAATFLFGHAAAQVRQIARWIEDVGLDIGLFVHRIEHKVIPRLLRELLHLGRVAALALIRPYIRTLARLYAVARHAAAVAAHAALHAEHAAAHALDWSEHEIGRVWHWRRSIEARLGRVNKLLVGAAFAALVATALKRLGLKWLRCSNTRNTAKRLCGMDVNLLESLLLDTTAIVGAISIVEFARELQAIEGEAVHLIRGFVREA